MPTAPSAAKVAAVATGSPVLLDGIVLDPAGSGVVIPKMVASGRMSNDLIGQLGLN
jgi:hypothetical protein